MSRLRDELRLIPWGAWLLAILAYLCLATVLLLHAVPHHPFFAKVLFSFGVPVALFLYVPLVGYIYGDARRRGMRHLMWALLAVFIPNGIGIILYFVLRDPILVPCPSCGLPSRADFTFCPRCGAALAPSCPQCRRPVEAGWSNCAHCGARLVSA